MMAQATIAAEFERAMMKATWDIFCSVVDNYGDIGVTWRLARQLAAEHQQQVRLWVDDLSAFVRICPEARLEAVQWQAGVEVRQWPTPWQSVTPAQIVVEAFACQLPEAFVQTMATQSQPPLWLNLEYLSAEDWVASCHGLPSLQADGQRKFFYFPGFTRETGGLLRERGLLEQAKGFASDEQAKRAFLKQFGIDYAGQQLISLFSYEQPQLSSWLHCLTEQVTPVVLLVPDSRVRSDVERFLGQPLETTKRVTQGSLTLCLLPFVAQPEFDRLLWACDFNVVRGEDSLVRALWASKPMLWDIYKQAEDAHLDKLQAFFELYGDGLSEPVLQALHGFYWAWNQQADLAGPWQRLQQHWLPLSQHAQKKAQELAKAPDLASGLVQFCSDWL